MVLVVNSLSFTKVKNIDRVQLPVPKNSKNNFCGVHLQLIMIKINNGDCADVSKKCADISQ